MQKLHATETMRQLGYFFLTGLILVIPALMNNAPLVYSDTGTYLFRVRDLAPPIDRPIGYSLIIRAVTWQSTLWTVVFFQGMVASWLIHCCMRTLFPSARGTWRSHVLLLVVLLALSSLPWYASQLMPDVYSALIILCVFLVLFGRELSSLELFTLWIFLFFFSISHYSHLVLILLLSTLLATSFAFGALRRFNGRRVKLGLIGLFIVPIMGIGFVTSYNAIHGYGFVLSPTSSLFLSGKLIESGAMRIYLDRTCQMNPSFLCDHREKLDRTGMHYVWDDDAPTRMGVDMIEASKRMDPIVHDLLGSPHMWPVLVWTSMLSTVQQFLQIDIGSGLRDYGKESSPWWPIQEYWPHELANYMMSVQQRGAWGFGFLNALNMWLMLASCTIIVIKWPSRSQLRLWSFVFILAVGTIANAAATGALANVYDRLQARVTWLLIFAALSILLSCSSRVRRLFLVPPATK